MTIPTMRAPSTTTRHPIDRPRIRFAAFRIGMVGDTTDSLPWKQRAVTFLENHDTGYRTNEDGTPQEHHEFDSFANGWEVEQGYAYILTHPGVPCVYWKHYFDWGDDLRGKIKALVNARKVAGVKSGSPIHTQNNAQAAGVYAAMVEGAHGRLYVRIGGSDAAWAPGHSSYADFREYAHGAGWKVWVGLLGNPEVQQGPLKQPIPVPVFHAPATFATAASARRIRSGSTLATSVPLVEIRRERGRQLG